MARSVAWLGKITSTGVCVCVVGARSWGAPQPNTAMNTSFSRAHDNKQKATTLFFGCRFRLESGNFTRTQCTQHNCSCLFRVLFWGFAFRCWRPTIAGFDRLYPIGLSASLSKFYSGGRFFGAVSSTLHREISANLHFSQCARLALHHAHAYWRLHRIFAKLSTYTG